MRSQRRVPARIGLEDEETDLVLGDVDQLLEPDARPFPRHLVGGRSGPQLASRPFSRSATCEVGLDEVARHAAQAKVGMRRRKRKNV